MANKPSPDELKQELSEMQFYVTQNHGTEPPFTGRLLHNKKTASTTAWSAMRRYFTHNPSMTPAVAGQASMSR